MKVFLGVDWGGTYIKAGILSDDGRILDKKILSSQKLKEKNVFINEIGILLESFSGYEIKGIGIGAPGIVDIAKGFIYYLPNIAGWKNYPLKAVLESKFNFPIYIDNDANVFALAEARLGVAKGYKRGIFLTLGTGLGGAVIFEGKILKGKTSACELGHVPLNVSGRLCGCGGRGCIETYTGNKYLVERYRYLKKIKNNRVEVKDIFEKALKGEKQALIVWQEFSNALGKFLAGMINVFNPEVIVFGGGVSGAFKVFSPLIWQVIKKQAMWPQVKGLKLVKAKVQDAGIAGAGLLAKENMV